MEIEFIKNEDLTEDILERVITLKMEYWPYLVELQKKWILENLQKDDIHVYIWKDEKIVAYMNLVNLKIEKDNIRTEAYGIGNVCVDKAYSGLGMGKLLMSAVYVYLKEERREGLLLCKKDLISFYTQSNWEIINGEQVNIFVTGKKFEQFCMIINGNKPEKTLYIDRNF